MPRTPSTPCAPSPRSRLQARAVALLSQWRPRLPRSALPCSSCTAASAPSRLGRAAGHRRRLLQARDPR
eukprot:6737182-Alexandrium_andersonii.AAC.1